MFKGFALTIAGCDVAFTTGGQSALTSSSDLWPSPASVADGWLAWPRVRWSERAKPLDGDLDVSPLSFTLHDGQHAAAGGSHLLTLLAARDAVNATSTPLASSITASATSATVGDGSLFTAPCIAWCEREAWAVSAVAGNVLTITRGALGTKATAHTVDAARTLYPEVFTSFPWATRRKVVLWGVDANNDCTALWSGFATRAPALDDDGARYTLACDPAWVVQRQNPVGGDLASVKVVGYARTGIAADSLPGDGDALLRTTWTLNGTGRRAYAVSNGPFRDWDALARSHEADVASRTATAGTQINCHINRSGTSVTLNADAATSVTAAFSCSPIFAGRVLPRVPSEYRTATRQALTLSFADVPSSLYITTPNATSTVLVSGLAGLPSSWSAVTNTLGGLTTVEVPALRAHISEDWSLLLTGVTTTDGGTLGPRVTGAALPMPRKPALRQPPDVLMLKDGPALQAVYRVRTDHWALGLRYSVVALCEDAHPDDWDWTDVQLVTRATAGLRTARDWVFDGRRTLGSVVNECCLLHGCSPVLRGARLALHAWGWPSAAETPAAAVTAVQIIGKPTWKRWTDGLSNRLQIKSPELTIDASQAQSRARYGPGRVVTVELAGLDDQASPIADPQDFARSVMGRLELWSEPLGCVVFTVPCDLAVGDGTALTELELGRELRVTEWMVPDGAGGRGLTAARAFVLARDIDLGAATVQVEAALFLRQSYPYAPCAKAGSVVSGTVLALATGYVGGATSYSGAGDATTFAAGDVVDLIERDTTTAWTERLTIASVDTGLGRITFTGAMSATAQTKIAGGWVDVRYAPFADCTAAQQAAWMFVGDDTAEVIDGTATRARAIAP